MKRILSFILLLSILLPMLLVMALAYEDVPEDAWYTDAAEFAASKGLILEFGNDFFLPDEVISRAMAAMVAWRLHGAPEVDPEEWLPFSDLIEPWYAQAVVWAYWTQVMKGYYTQRPSWDVGYGGLDYTFKGEQDATREQLATILFRLAKYCKYDTSARAQLTFTDASQVSPWALDAMQWAVAEGLIEGSADGGALLLAPERSITRAEAAVMVMRFCEKFQVAAEP